MNADRFAELKQEIAAWLETKPAAARTLLAVVEQDPANLGRKIEMLWRQFAESKAIQEALLLAAQRHADQQYYLLSGPVPYLVHLVNVSLCTQATLQVNEPLTIICALWHDMIEDDKITPAELVKFVDNSAAFQQLADWVPEGQSVSAYILEILEALNRPAGDYDAPLYYNRIFQSPPEARVVKAADLICNSSQLITGHRSKYRQGSEALHLKEHLIPKYTTEVVSYVLEQPAYQALDVYPAIHNSLLGIFRQLSNYLQEDFPDQVSRLDELARQEYGTSYRQALESLAQITPV